MENLEINPNSFKPDENRSQTPLRYSKPYSKDTDIQIGPIKITCKSVSHTQKLKNTTNTRDFSLNTSFYNHDLLSQKLNNFKAKKYTSSISPNIRKLNSPKVFSFNIEKEEKRYNYVYFAKGTKKLHHNLNLPPKINYFDFKADLPLCDANNTIVHKYALPQALVPVRTPSPIVKIPSIAEESVISRPHPISRKGYSGWKLSFQSIYMNKGKKGK
ncbi:hypothetical protein SteCoe_29560 [Stentor coeruleus]|uniref:Uncharacterized protein n=1 Tax=Stentor coeruleus TaxID=5963 RepID=A0A1R2B622_9CILI|nr:hypothetical protein SteCoe_29560 [Stentor coeruleus]